jgi:MATE family multidrug resistance protein
MGSVGLIYFLFPGFIIGWFDRGAANTGDLFKLATLMLTISSVWQLFDAAGITISEALRAAGDTTFCMLARLVLAWLVFTPVSYALVVWYGGGVSSMMFCFVGYLALLAVTFALRFLSNKWRAIDLVGEPVLVDAE